MSEQRSDPASGLPARRGNLLYRAVLVAAGIVAAIVFAFFFVGLADGSVSSFNIALWLGLLALVIVVMIAGHGLHARGSNAAAIAILGVLAVPGLLYGLFILLVVFSGARWN